MSKIRRSPKKISKPTHKYMGELFLLDGEKIFIWSWYQSKLARLWKSFNHDELILLFSYDDRFKIKPL